MGASALWRLAVPALLLSVGWLAQGSTARALTPSANSEQHMTHPGISLGDVLLTGDLGTRALQNKDVSGERTRKLRNYLAREIHVSQESFAGYSGQNEGSRAASRLSSSSIEISKVELGSAGAHGSWTGGGLAISADLAGRMALQSAVGSPILLSKEENPYYYMQQGNHADFGDVSNAESITKLEWGFIIVAVVLLLLGLGAGAYFALYGSTNQADADDLTDATKSQDGKEQRVLRLRSQSVE